jgi:hypothetical protein
MIANIYIDLKCYVLGIAHDALYNLTL